MNSQPDPRNNKAFVQAMRFLNQFPKIRFYIPDEPGMGHQALALNTLQNVLEYGYPGEIEVVFNPTPENDRKLALMIPDWPSRPVSPQSLDADPQKTPPASRQAFGKVTFKPASLASELEPLPFGIIAGFTLEAHTRSTKQNDLPASVEALNTDQTLIVQPEGWKGSTIYRKHPAENNVHWVAHDLGPEIHAFAHRLALKPFPPNDTPEQLSFVSPPWQNS